MTNDEMRRRAKKLIRDCKMPTLRELSFAVLEARQKYSVQIRMARRKARRDESLSTTTSNSR